MFFFSTPNGNCRYIRSNFLFDWITANEVCVCKQVHICMCECKPNFNPKLCEIKFRLMCMHEHEPLSIHICIAHSWSTYCMNYYPNWFLCKLQFVVDFRWFIFLILNIYSTSLESNRSEVFNCLVFFLYSFCPAKQEHTFE